MLVGRAMIVGGPGSNSEEVDSMSVSEEASPDLCETHLELGEDWRSFNRHLRASCAHDSSPVQTLFAREVGARGRRQFGSVRRVRAPGALRETSFGAAARFNKFFAHAWLDDDHVVTGSKCNKLAVWDVAAREPAVKLIALPESQGPMNPSFGGIHDLALNGDRSLLASGSSNANETVVLDTHTWQPRAVCVGHTDWMFGAQFVRDDVLFTCSRDKLICVWKVPPASETDGQMAVVRPSSVLPRHNDKVRAMRYNANSNLLCSLGADAYMHFWDPSTGQVVSSLRARDQEDLVCVGVDSDLNLFACGGRDYISVADPRMDTLLLNVLSMDEASGVRSVAFHQRMLSMGGGLGRLSFFDLVAGKFVPCQPESNNNVNNDDDDDREAPRYNRYFHELGAGYAAPNAVVDDSKQALYTHGWNDRQSRLFTGGGPLLIGVDGAYAGVWH